MTTDMPTAYDFIIVGGGTAGNVVAGRLAENPIVSILIIEAGIGNPTDVTDITTPSRAFSLRGGKHDWGYKTAMIARPDYERVEKPNTRGKALGGSTCLNLLYLGSDWTWETTKEYFDKPANYHDDEGLYDPELKKVGRNGPLDISHSALVPELKPFRDALLVRGSARARSCPKNIYSGTQYGLVQCMNTIYKGVRSTSGCFVKGKPNITILASTNSKKINFEGTQATGVTVLVNGEKELTFSANKEIIVSQGVFETPKLLMLSGIGPERELAAHNITPVVVSEHVGQNLLDHSIMPYVRRLKDGLGLDSHLLRPGPASSGLLELVGFPRVDAYLEESKEYMDYKKANGGIDSFGPAGQPHFEIDFVPMFSDAFQWHIPTPPTGDYITVIVDLLRPLSRNGFVKLNSTDPLEQPFINLNFFSNDLDLIAMREGCRMVDDILTTGEGMRDIIGQDYPWEMPRWSDEAMKKAILERSQTGFHPCGTCRLSKSIEQGVVDAKLRVHGTRGLRVVDASVIPVIPDCRIQNSVYMIGEKGADIITAAYPDFYSVQS
ncbi:GMC oxidoreductase [Lentithecium fluviatile CBS 122367]|uniref:GMC oxidoreductase n=1 Tax=Lentithecium fluviatile CBS 122367 TaxID=1168545 RepID=A0A6G1IJ34_9PLEO|nr:GMC oxidoreductase [Lentithecium fluviatile CBS 122367]